MLCKASLADDSGLSEDKFNAAEHRKYKQIGKVISLQPLSSVMHLFRTIFAIATLAVGLVSASVADASENADLPLPTDHPGAAIYQKLCVECHADDGRGVPDKADDPLVGNRDIPALANRIERSMPEDEEDLCVAEDAKAVAEYIYHAFYSVEARARNTPARVELSRLTADQHRKSIADLVLSFRGDMGYGKERGWRAYYYGDFKYNEREKFRKEKKKDRFECHDPRINFDYGTGIPQHPEAKEFIAERFSVRWEATIIPEQTGEYEFVIRTRNGATLWVNENDHNDEGTVKTIDGHVAPNNELREISGRAWLIGGRPHPVRLEFFTYKEDKATIELLWKPPHGSLQIIPQHNVSPDRVHESVVAETPFPADDRSVGYERGTAVSRTWIDAVNASATETADYVVDHLNGLVKAKKDQPFEERARKIGDFGVQFVSRAFRRPLNEEERVRHVDQYYKDAESLEHAVRKLVLATLTSPQFLYPELGAKSNPDGKPDSWTIANRLALMLWDSLPTGWLIERAKNDHLQNPQQIHQATDKMVWDWRTRAKMRGFFHHWLELERADDLAKDKKAFPEFNEALLADQRTSLQMFLDHVVWESNADYRHLLTADYLFLNGRLGKLYGKVDAGGAFQKVQVDPKRRAGIITHPFLLTSFAYHDNTSPIHRGVFLTRNIVGMTLKSPPMANEFKNADFDPKMTMREKVTELTRSKACMGCHVTINPLGFSLEHFDGIGRWRLKDQDKPVNSNSDFKTDAGATIKITGARDVADYAANSPSAHRAFVQQLFHHTVKQPVAAYGHDQIDTLREDFAKHGFNILHLLRSIAKTAATHPVGPES